MQTRVLIDADAAAIAKLYRDLPKVFKQKLSEDVANAIGEAMIQALSSPMASVIGAFENNELVGTLRCTRWKALPYYTIHDLRSLNPAGSLRAYVEVFDSLMTHLLKTMESEGRFDFYFLNLQRNFHKSLFEQEGRQRRIPRFFTHIRRYELCVEDVIPPGVVSPWPAFREMTAERGHQVPLWVRRGSLKTEFRKDYWESRGILTTPTDAP